jgi:tyrosyl-tRNA synthetase
MTTTASTAPSANENLPLTDRVLEALAITKRGVDELLIEKRGSPESWPARKNHVPLRIKLGLDPTAPDLHLGPR